MHERRGIKQKKLGYQIKVTEQKLITFLEVKILGKTYGIYS